MSASISAQSIAEERKKKNRLKYNSNKIWQANKSAAKIFKHYLKGENQIFFQFDYIKLDELKG